MPNNQYNPYDFSAAGMGFPPANAGGNGPGMYYPPNGHAYAGGPIVQTPTDPGGRNWNRISTRFIPYYGSGSASGGVEATYNGAPGNPSENMRWSAGGGGGSQSRDW